MPKLLVKPLRRLKSDAALAKEWDQLAKIRHEQIVSKKDISYHKVIIPTLLELCKSGDMSKVLDVGCGSGFLDFSLWKKGIKVTGIDPSAVSISIANNAYARPNLDFCCVTAQRFAKRNRGTQFTSVIANMTLQDCSHLDSLMTAIASVMTPHGTFSATLTHPAFWPRYWGYDKAPWFKYSDEIAIEAPFKISREATRLRTTHIHRPLSLYIETIRRAGFKLVDLKEPMPSKAIQACYPAAWKFPRFLAIRCVKS
jgi:SAM-dependent methyltransferase